MEESGGLAARLQAALTAAGITGAELARRAGVTRAYAGRLLAGQQAAPTPEVLAALAEALEMGAEGRVQLFAAAGYLPPELAVTLAEPTVARLLLALTTAPPARRAALGRLLAAALDLAE